MRARGHSNHTPTGFFLFFFSEACAQATSLCMQSKDIGKSSNLNHRSPSYPNRNPSQMNIKLIGPGILNTFHQKKILKGLGNIDSLHSYSAVVDFSYWKNLSNAFVWSLTSTSLLWPQKVHNLFYLYQFLWHHLWLGGKLERRKKKELDVNYDADWGTRNECHLCFLHVQVFCEITKGIYAHQ